MPEHQNRARLSLRFAGISTSFLGAGWLLFASFVGRFCASLSLLLLQRFQLLRSLQVSWSSRTPRLSQAPQTPPTVLAPQLFQALSILTLLIFTPPLLSACDSGTPSCEPDCGEGMRCVLEGDEGVCRAEGEVRVELNSPKKMELGRSAPFQLACSASAPLLQAVNFLISPPEPAATLSIPARLEKDLWVAEYGESQGAGLEGPHQLRCELLYGAKGQVQHQRSDVHTLLVDRSPPQIEILSASRWLQPSETFELVAQVLDEPSAAKDWGGVGVDLESVVLWVGEEGEFLPAQVEDNTFSFKVDLGLLFKADFSGNIGWLLQAKDKLGNRTMQGGPLGLGAQPPRFELSNELLERWYPRQEAELLLPFSLSRPEPQPPLLAAPVLKNPQGEQLATARIEDGDWVIPIVPAALIEAGEEGAVELALWAEDEAGLEGELSFSLKIDDKAPSLKALENPDWVRRGETAEVLLEILDSGSGLTLESARVLLGSQDLEGDGGQEEEGGGELESVACEALENHLYSCQIPSTLAPSGVEASLELSLEMQDQVGNRQLLPILLPVDDLPPRIAPSDSKFVWLGGLRPSEFELSVQDFGVGVAGLRAELEGLGEVGGLQNLGVLEELENPEEQETLESQGNQENLAGLADRAGLDALMEADDLETLGKAGIASRAEDEQGENEQGIGGFAAFGSACEFVAGERWKCSLDTSKLADSSSDLRVQVRSQDGVGNESQLELVLGLDLDLPVLALENPLPWVGGEGPHFIGVHAGDLHSGLELVEIQLENEWLACLLDEEEDELPPEPFFQPWRCPLPNLEPGVDGELPFRLRASDAVGWVSELQAALPVDTLGPVIEVDSDAWLPRRGQVAVVLEIEDFGVGVDPAEVYFSRPEQSQKPCHALENGGFECLLDTLAAPEGEESRLAFGFHAKDWLGNASSKEVELKVDNKGPSISLIGPTQEWLAYGKENFIFRIEDSGVGMGVRSEVSSLTPLGEGATSREPIWSRSQSGTTVNFEVKAETFLPRKRSVSNFLLELRTEDLLGNESVLQIRRSFDDEQPQLSLDPFPYSSQGHIKRNAPPIELLATLVDEGRDLQGNKVEGSGVKTATLRYTNKQGADEILWASDLGGERFRWIFDPRDPLFDAVDGEVELHFELRDEVGNTTSQSRPLNMSRRLWERELRPGAIASFGPALADSTLVVPLVDISDAEDLHAELVALNAESGEVLWRADLFQEGGITLQELSIGREHVYLVHELGANTRLAAYRLKPPGQTPKVDWEASVPAPALRMAVVDWLWDGTGDVQETVLVPSKEGLYAAFEQSPGSGKSVQVFEGEVLSVAVNSAGIWSSAQGVTRFIKYHPLSQRTEVSTLLDSGPALSFVLKQGEAMANVLGQFVHWSSKAEVLESVPLWGGSGFPFSSPVLDGIGQVWWNSPADTLLLFAPPSFQLRSTLPLAASPGPLSGLSMGEDGSAYIAAEGKLMAVREDRGLVWTHDFNDTNPELYSPPLLACDGSVFVGTGDGRIVALASDSRGLSEAWPRPSGNNRNSNSTYFPARIGAWCVD